jgi:hypothetical protein
MRTKKLEQTIKRNFDTYRRIKSQVRRSKMILILASMAIGAALTVIFILTMMR